ncbi:MAG: glutathione S-transferase family protein [Pseudomonadota bacterium]
MILYGSQTSPYVRHCRIVLMQSGLPWTFQDTDYAASAAGSPTKRVPYFQDGDTRLTDSSSILMHLRRRLGQPYMEEVEQLECYALCNTMLDTAINLFLLERDGLGPTDSDYLARQQTRIESGLQALEQVAPTLPGNAAGFSDAEIRLGCFLDWGLFRQRIEIADLPALTSFLSSIRDWPVFADTAPPAGT